MNMWFFRSDSNITNDTNAANLRILWSIINDWKSFIEEKKNKNCH